MVQQFFIRHVLILLVYSKCHSNMMIINILYLCMLGRMCGTVEFTMLSQPLDPHLEPSGGMFHADVG